MIKTNFFLQCFFYEILKTLIFFKNIIYFQEFLLFVFEIFKKYNDY